MALHFIQKTEQDRANSRRVNASVERQLGPDLVQVLPVNGADKENDELENAKDQAVLGCGAAFLLGLNRLHNER